MDSKPTSCQPEKVGQSHVHHVSNLGVGQRKFTSGSVVSCFQPNPHAELELQAQECS